MVYRNVGAKEKAIQLYKRLIAFEESNENDLLAYVELLHQTKKDGESIAILEKRLYRQGKVDLADNALAIRLLEAYRYNHQPLKASDLLQSYVEIPEIPLAGDTIAPPPLEYNNPRGHEYTVGDIFSDSEKSH